MASPPPFIVPGAFLLLIPAGVTSATFDVFGAEGGLGGSSFISGNIISGAAGGRGGHATSTITVTPGDIIQINVGGKGNPGTGGNSITPGLGGIGGANGGW